MIHTTGIDVRFRPAWDGSERGQWVQLSCTERLKIIPRASASYIGSLVSRDLAHTSEFCGWGVPDNKAITHSILASF